MVTNEVEMAEKSRYPVARGGMWNTQQASYSKETQNLMKEMMKESRLTNFQQRQLDKAMKDGSSLPTKVHPTTSAKPKPEPKPIQVGPRIDPRSYYPVVRTKGQIESSGAYERDQFRPKPMTKFGGFYEKDKDRLANIMAYGEDLPPIDMKKVLQKAREQLKTPPEKDRFDELVQEINEREQFLADMESFGQGDKYRQIVATEISQLVREMEVIDQKRTAALNKFLKEQQKEGSKT